MEDFEINFQESSIAAKSSFQLPLNYLSFGDIERDDVKVYIKQDVYKALEQYALVDTDHERGTILVGSYYLELGNNNVIISNYIEARYTEASASTLTFTHETWDYVSKEHELLYNDKKIVGWQHTHPNYGIFLSNYDLFIHENFFNLPFQIAYVIDPIQNLRGFFQWKNGKIEKLKGYYIYDDIGVPIILAAETQRAELSLLHKGKKENLIEFGLVFLSLLCAAICAVFVSMERKAILASEAKIAQITQEINRISDEIEEKEEELNRQQHIISRQEAIIQEKSLTIDLQAQEIQTLQEKLGEIVNNPPEQPFIMHVVEPGESIPSICEKYHIDFWGNRTIIENLNGMKDINYIMAGQTIILPNVVKGS